MLYELSRRDFRKIAHMVEKHTNLEPQAIIADNNPGWVYVDDFDHPESALVWSQGIQGFYLMGNENNPRFNSALTGFLETEIIPRAQEMGYEAIEVSGTHKKWNPMLEAMFNTRALQHWTQRVYTYGQKDAPASRPLPKDYSLVQVDRNLLSSIHLHNLELVEREIELFWPSLKSFLHDGFAYCVMEGNTIASVAYASFMTNKAMALGVITDQNYRRKGLGLTVAAECVKHTLARKLTPYWDCTDNNVGSIRIAERLGFRKQWEYRCYGFSIKRN